MSKIVLVTGGTGFIGSYICRYLIKNSYQPIVLKRETSDVSLLSDILDQIEFVIGDLGDVVLLKALMDRANFVIHCAAMLSFKSADRDEIFNINVEGTANMVNMALNSDIEKFIHISSVSAFGKSKKDRVVNEESIWIESSLNSMYGISKQLAEREMYRGFAEGLNGIIICPSLVIGAGFWNKGTPSIIDRIAKGTPFYTLGSNGIVDVRDVAQIALKSLQINDRSIKIIASGENLSSREFITRFAKKLNSKIPKIGLNPWLGQLACLGDFCASIITGRDRLITRDSLKTTYNHVEYDNAISKELLSHQYIPFDQSVIDISESYLSCKKLNQAVGILDIN